MKRAPIVLTGTALGLAGVLTYHTASSLSRVHSGSSTASTKPSTKTTASSSSTSSTGTAQTRSATGQDVSSKYGDLQLKVTMAGTRLTDVSVMQLNANDPHSQSIDQFAVPRPRQEALAVQSAQIDGVSGASYTSAAYEQALQSALDKLGTTGSTQ
jgi:uncharacterized protein with FMN-binding domain